MRTYPAGDLTKAKLYEKAREVFYESGYNKASMKEVCQRADVKQSVFYYHYKDKSEPAKKLYENFGKAHSRAITEEIINKRYTTSVVITNCICSALLLLNSIQDPKIGRFWAEMYTDNLTANIGFHRHFHENMYRKSGLPFDQNDFEFFLINCASINCSLMLNYFDGRFQVTPEELARYKTKHTLRYLEYSNEEIAQMTDKVIEIAAKIPITAGENFEIKIDNNIIF